MFGFDSAFVRGLMLKRRTLTQRERTSLTVQTQLVGSMCFWELHFVFNLQAPYSKNSPGRDEYRDKQIDINQQPSCVSTQRRCVHRSTKTVNKESRVYLRSGEAEVWCDIQVPSVRQTSCRSAATCWRPRVEKRSRTQIDHVWGVNGGSRQH